MMRKTVVLTFVFMARLLSSQTYSSLNITMLGHINPNNSTVTPGWAGNWYSGCWGWYQASTNKEYAIIGASNGTYFIDVSSPVSPSVSAFVPGRTGCTWREIKTYQNYCYVVSDDAAPNTFQIIDMSALPSTVTLVYNDKTLFERGHTIWIDQNKMYVGGVTTSVTSYPMAVYSLSTPTAPVLLRDLSQDISSSLISYVHDMYVRNDTVYASCGYQGLYVLKFNASANTFSILGSYQNYGPSSYNHSSFLTNNGKYLVFCDEVPSGIPIHLVNVQNFSNIQPVQTFIPASGTIPHNPYIIGNNFAVVSCYHDGLVIYNISQPNAVSLAGYFDTYPQAGFQQNDYSGYRGNWGAYPYLPSGNIIANDMQNGVFILNASAAFTTSVQNPVGLNESDLASAGFRLYPNPASSSIRLTHKGTHDLNVKILDMLGKELMNTTISVSGSEEIDISNLSAGTYLVSSGFGLSKHQELLIITR